MGDILDLAERFWSGDIDRRAVTRPSGKTEEIAPGVLFIHGWANVTAITAGSSVILVDTGSYTTRDKVFAAVRAFVSAPVGTAIYTHGHVDHACGLPPFIADARAQGWPRPRVVAHRNVPARFERYRATAGYNALINARQFSIPPYWPTEYDYPDVTYDDTYAVLADGVRLELRHARGETDDHTWIWWEERKILFTGDQFFWVAPNAGNPQKVQRYPDEWAASLREMATRNAELLIPGHGVPIVGAARVRRALTETAEWLQALVDETLARMNAGATLDAILQEVRPPAHLAARPYLQAVYDEPEYVVRNVWRLYGGWYDGVPSHLKPAPESQVGREIAALAGGVTALLHRARALAAVNDLRMASHLVDWATAAEPHNIDAHRVRAEVYAARAGAATALMTRGIFSAAARDSEAAAASER